MKRFLRGSLSLLAVALLSSSCSSIAQYSKHAGANACGELDRCSVYAEAGEKDEPCIAMRSHLLYPGDSEWPFAPGVCPQTAPSSANRIALR
ncbi:MAG TPA: hypothetical protein VEI94_13150 [Candidatus Bathyarchaeia archaeon]|nr:hypothetical protein [Candidatus Bathyarchaeia archaeon]